MSCHLISVLLLRAHGLALSMYMHNLLSTQVLGPPFLTMRWFVIGCPCALDSFSLQPHTPLSRLVSSSRLRSFVLLLTVRANVCVSASRLLFPRRFVTVLQGGSDPFSRHCLTKTLLHGAYIIAPLYIYDYIYVCIAGISLSGVSLSHSQPPVFRGPLHYLTRKNAVYRPNGLPIWGEFRARCTRWRSICLWIKSVPDRSDPLLPLKEGFFGWSAVVGGPSPPESDPFTPPSLLTQVSSF